VCADESPELAAEELRAARAALGLAGGGYAEATLERVFAACCVGK
jgi:tRNA U34 5-carboxymethylaminomethyl modifying GTPase MnmE/TrmE